MIFYIVINFFLVYYINGKFCIQRCTKEEEFMPKKSLDVSEDNKEVKAKKATKDDKKEVKAEKKTTAKKVESKPTKTSTKKAESSTTKTKKSSKAEEKDTTKKSRKTSLPKSVSKKVEKDLKKLEEISNNEVKPKESEIISKIKDFLLKVSKLQDEEKKKEIESKTKDKTKKEKKEIEAEKKLSYSIEYYDLPYRYNETVVKILAQTPKRLFVYWDISDNDRNRFIETFGNNFFNDTYPVLLIHNEEKNYTFEVPINDFANSWYLDIPDPKSKYTIQLGRKFKYKNDIDYQAAQQSNIVLQNDYLPITTSNTLEVPNDHILFENLRPYVIYRNVKNYQETIIDISNLDFARRMGKIYNVYDIYKEIYKNELGRDGLLNLINPSSMSSSKMNSSYFK